MKIERRNPKPHVKPSNSTLSFTGTGFPASFLTQSGNFGLVLALLVFSFSVAPAAHGEDDIVLTAMEQEISRSMKGFGEQADPSPYFIGYQITDSRNGSIQASHGALQRSTETHGRFLNVTVRVGDYELDNTRGVRGEPGVMSLFRRGGIIPVSIDGDLDSLRASLWRETDRQYRIAVEDLEKIRASLEIKVEEESTVGDFTREESQVSLDPRAPYSLDKELWEGRLKAFSRMFLDYPEILTSQVDLVIVATTKYIVNSEGTRLRFGETRLRLALSASTRADDGMNLYRYGAFHAADWSQMPTAEEVRKEVRRLARELTELRASPASEAYSGPAILSGRAAGVFFHEVLGHRVEGHRQRDEFEGQTFARKLGEKILPDFISILDDPTRPDLGGQPLMGHFRYDDQGVPSQSVTIVEDGVLRNFLLSRRPIGSFTSSNGHGRRQPGGVVTARQGNLIVEAGERVPYAELRRKLLEMVRRQEKDYGLVFEDIAGGFTETMRFGPQTFQVLPLMVYRVFADGRPDELVRGLGIVGTPLTVLGKIVGASDQSKIFNGVCVAESGAVPVSATSPALLISEIEVQKQPKGFDRPPLLPPPAIEY